MARGVLGFGYPIHFCPCRRIKTSAGLNLSPSLSLTFTGGELEGEGGKLRDDGDGPERVNLSTLGPDSKATVGTPSRRLGPLEPDHGS